MSNYIETDQSGQARQNTNHELSILKLIRISDESYDNIGPCMCIKYYKAVLPCRTRKFLLCILWYPWANVLYKLLSRNNLQFITQLICHLRLCNRLNAGDIVIETYTVPSRHYTVGDKNKTPTKIVEQCLYNLYMISTPLKATLLHHCKF